MDPEPGSAGAALADERPEPVPPGLPSGEAGLPSGEERTGRNPEVAAARGRRLPPASRLVAYTHVATLVGAFGFWLWLDRGLWFFGDEWDFLVERGLAHGPTNPASIWFPHNEHWSTLPIVLWRGLFSVFHLGSYWPYLVPLLLAHVAVMHLVWRLCRGAGADPWVSTAAAALLGVLGAGAEDLTWGFQIGFVGSVMFGLLAFNMLDRPIRAAGPAGHDPRLVRRDALISLALVASLMCSTIGDAMVVGAAVLASARLPWRRVLNVICPPVAVYGLWFAVVGHLGPASHSDRLSLATLTDLPNYLLTGLSSALGQSLNLEPAGGAFLVGLAVWVAYRSRALWHKAPALLGLCAAAAAFYALAALGRDASTVSPSVSRYVYVALALLLPAIAVLLSPVRAWRAATAAAVAFLVLSALGNVGQARTWASARVTLTTGLKTDVFATARLLGDGVQDVSGPGAAPIGAFPNLTASSLAHLERSRLLGRLPLSPQDLVNARTMLAIGTWDGSATTLTGRPLFAGRFDYVTSTHSMVQDLPGHCLTFDPDDVAAPVQVWLKIPAGEQAASVRVIVPPATSASANYLAGVLVPPVPPTTSVPAELAVPPKGTGYLDDNDAGAQMVAMWNVGTPLTLCGLANTK